MDYNRNQSEDMMKNNSSENNNNSSASNNLYEDAVDREDKIKII